MLSAKFIRLIEAHSAEISRRAIRQIHQDTAIKEIRQLHDLELRERSEMVLRNLGQWLAAGREAKLIHQYEDLGRIRFEEHIPLHETVRVLQILRAQIADFLQEQGLPETSIDLYAEEEMEQRVARFFDELIFHLVRGYEHAMKVATHSA